MKRVFYVKQGEDCTEDFDLNSVYDSIIDEHTQHFKNNYKITIIIEKVNK